MIESDMSTAITHETVLEPTTKIIDATKSTTGSQQRFTNPAAESKPTGMRRALALARLARRRKVRRHSGHSPRGSPSRPVDRSNTKQDYPKALNHGDTGHIFCGPRARKLNNLGRVHAFDQSRIESESGSPAELKYLSTPRTPGKVSVIIADTDSIGAGPVHFRLVFFTHKFKMQSFFTRTYRQKQSFGVHVCQSRQLHKKGQGCHTRIFQQEYPEYNRL